MLSFMSAGQAMPEGLNGKQIVFASEGGICKPGGVELGGGGEGVDEDDGWVGGVVAGELVPGGDAAQVGDFEGFRGDHFDDVSGSAWMVVRVPRASGPILGRLSSAC